VATLRHRDERRPIYFDGADMKSLSTIRIELGELIAAIGEVLGDADVLPLVRPARRKPRKERSQTIRRAVRRASHRRRKLREVVPTQDAKPGVVRRRAVKARKVRGGKPGLSSNGEGVQQL
jgi:hypothetical protein